MTARLAAGRIVWAEIADANGIRKLRPVVLLRAADPASGTGPFDAVAVTSRLSVPLPEDHVPLPWHPRGHPRTGLNRRCAAVCTWLAQIEESDIREVAGLVPTPILSTILARVRAAASGPSPSAGDAPAAGPPTEPPAPPPAPGPGVEEG
jgi:hypothetical protein